MNKIEEFANKIAFKGVHDKFSHKLVWKSKTDGSYIGDKWFKTYMEHGITEQIQSGDGEGSACFGFNPKEQKWYGWSHRAIFGFGIGSVCKKGDCGYVPDNVDELYDSLSWFSVRLEKTPRGVVGISKFYPYIEVKGGKYIPDKAKPITYRRQLFPLGRGAWIAKTMEDAKQMAIDFAEGVG